MENDLDMKLYQEYLNGEKGAFEILYNKYKEKITYFVYNIVKDYDKAEDITQEVFIYILGHHFEGITSFKYHLYLVAKSRAFNYWKSEKRRTELNEQFLSKEDGKVEADIAEIISKNEERKEVLEAINGLNEKYRNALYLNKIEEMSYQETAEILGETESNIKNLIHRGKKELRKILVKKGFEDMRKVSKIAVMILCIGLVLSGVVYAVTQVMKKRNPENVGKVQITPTFTSGISTMDENKLWVGTFNLVWNDLMDEVIKGKVEFEDGDSELADELNKQSFKATELSEDAYYKTYGKATQKLKEKIENGIKEKFDEESKVLNQIDWDDPNGYILYAILRKKFTYLEPFSTTMRSIKFNNSEERVKCFGVDNANKPDAGINVEVLFYNSEEDFAIKLKTNEGEEVILYKTSGEGKSFEENYQMLLEQQKVYTEDKEFQQNDILRIPFIQVHDEINYDELCGKVIEGTGIYIKQAIQTIDFELNNVGGSVKSEAVIEGTLSGVINPRRMIFDSDFILFLKEKDKEKPYFALKVDNIDVLVVDEEEIN